MVGTLLGVPASAAETTGSIGDGLAPREGITTRFDAYTALASLRDAPPDGVPIEPVTEADRHARAALAHVRGDAMISQQGFLLDEKVIDALAPLRSGASAAVAERIGTRLADADQVAAARELLTFQSLPFTTDTASVDSKGRPVSRDAVISDFTEEYELSTRAEAAGDLESAVQHAGAAWLKVSTAVADYLTRADVDGDLLSEDKELALGLSPTKADSDGDGLADSVELMTTMTDPTRPVTHEAKGPDLTADLDSDGLGNDAELRAGTDPLDPDSDGDTLLDGAELAFGSDPALPDTDADRLRDDSEQRVGTDPRDPDSDDDGLLDGDETYTTSVQAAAALGAAVRITGVGDVGRTVRVRDESASTLYSDFPGSLSKAVDLSTTADFSSATVTFSFDPASVPGGDTAGLAVGYYDEQAGALVPLPTTVDPATGKASAVTDHFTTFVLFYVPNWNAAFTGQDTGGGGGPGDTGVDVMLTLDSSGSMSWNDPQGLRRTAAKSFVDGLIAGDRAGVVDFDSSAWLRQALTTDLAAAKAAIDGIDDSGGTNIGAGVRIANNELITRSAEDRVKAQILLTDGEGSYDHALTSQAAANDITIYTIGLGSSVDATLLSGIASGTGGQYFAVAQASDLPKVFDRIGSGIDPAKDSDEDGLLDKHEIMGMVTGTGKTVYSDPEDPDTDGDGLLDGDELVQRRDIGAPYPVFYFHLVSDPHLVDSDGDRLDDAEEVEMGSFAMIRDQDSDGATDGEEYERGWPLNDANVDGDSYDDGEELAAGTDALSFDPSVADRARALAAGAVLGELGYWLADRGLSVGVSIAYPPIGPPTIAPEVEGLSLCDVPFVKCVGLFTFQPVDVEQVEYVLGMVVSNLVPFVDVIAAVRDTIGAVLNGEYGWAVFEVLAGALGFFVPVAGDVPGILKDFGKYIGKFPHKVDDLVRAVATFDKLDRAEPIRVLLIKGLKPVVTNRLSNAGLTNAGLVGLAKGGRSLDDLAAAVRQADEVGRLPGRFFDATATRGYWGREAEDLVRSSTGGVSRRLATTVIVNGKASPRVTDSLVDDGLDVIATEVKTGDGAMSSRHATQIAKDVDLYRRGVITEVRWEFFASARSHTVGPDPALLTALRNAGIPVTIKIWLP